MLHNASSQIATALAQVPLVGSVLYVSALPMSSSSSPWVESKARMNTTAEGSSDFFFPWQSEVPQFIVYTADDAIQSYTLASVNQFLAQRKNPNGCQPKITYYTSLNYTNYTLVTDWFVAGNEIADHTLVAPLLRLIPIT
jgi:hypothetical protein